MMMFISCDLIQLMFHSYSRKGRSQNRVKGRDSDNMWGVRLLGHKTGSPLPPQSIVNSTQQYNHPRLQNESSRVPFALRELEFFLLCDSLCCVLWIRSTSSFYLLPLRNHLWKRETKSIVLIKSIKNKKSWILDRPLIINHIWMWVIKLNALTRAFRK